MTQTSCSDGSNSPSPVDSRSIRITPANDSKSPPRIVIHPSDWPDRPHGPSVPQTVANLEYLLRRYNITCRFNRMSKRPVVDIPSRTFGAENRDAVVLTAIEDLAIRHGMGTQRIAQNLLALADRSPFDPVADWIDSAPWDGVDRLPAFYATVTPAADYDLAFRNVLIGKWLISGIAATYMPSGFRARGVLTFQGEQGLGKSSWFRRLLPSGELGDRAIRLGHSWDGGSKDARLLAIQHRFVEFGELEGSFRRELASLKAFVTDEADKMRPPYARAAAEYARRTIFGASVNDPAFLSDPTGNSRFWTIPVVAIDYRHDIDMQQLFAQLKQSWQTGAEWWLSPEEERQLSEVNNRHRVVSPIAERLTAAMDFSLIGSTKCQRMSAGEALSHIGIDKPTNPQFKEANACLRELLGESSRVKGVNLWWIPWAEPEATPAYYPMSSSDPRKVGHNPVY